MKRKAKMIETGYVTLGKLRRRENCSKGYCRCCGWKVEKKPVPPREQG